VQASTFNKDFDVNFILFLGLRLVVNFQASPKNTLGVCASRVLLKIRLSFPPAGYKLFLQPFLALAVV
jgi:hypothetical protein